MSVGSKLFAPQPPQPDSTQATVTSMAPVNARDMESLGSRTDMGPPFCSRWQQCKQGFRPPAQRRRALRIVTDHVEPLALRVVVLRSPCRQRDHFARGVA